MNQIGENQNNLSIELSEEDAILFRKFREHQDVFQTFVRLGVFNIRTGNTTIHFDNEGKVSLIDVHTFTKL